MNHETHETHEKKSRQFRCLAGVHPAGEIAGQEKGLWFSSHFVYFVVSIAFLRIKWIHFCAGGVAVAKLSFRTEIQSQRPARRRFYGLNSA
jgi:hypothetical protein